MKYLNALVGLSALWMISGCDASTKVAVVEEVKPIRIFNTRVLTEDIITPVLATGEVTADKRTDIKPRVDGIIEEIYVDVGDHVSTGTPLLKTRQLDYANRVRELKFAVDLARVELEQADRDMARALTLRDRGVVSQGRMDVVATQQQMARSRLGIAEANLTEARQDLHDTIVRAPYDGIITARHIDEGTMIHVVSSSIIAVEIIKLDVVEVIAHLPAIHMARITQGSRVSVKLDGFEEPLESTLSVINDRIDAYTRSVEVRIRLENPDLVIKPGLFAKVSLYPDPRPALTLDRKAVLGLKGDNYVFVPDAGFARRRSVTIQDLDASRVEVLAGIEAGDIALIGPNLPNLKDGSPIEGLLKVHGSR